MAGPKRVRSSPQRPASQPARPPWPTSSSAASFGAGSCVGARAVRATTRAFTTAQQSSDGDASEQAALVEQVRARELRARSCESSAIVGPRTRAFKRLLRALCAKQEATEPSQGASKSSQPLTCAWIGAALWALSCGSGLSARVPMAAPLVRRVATPHSRGAIAALWTSWLS